MSVAEKDGVGSLHQLIAGDDGREKEEGGTSPALLVLMCSKDGRTHLTVCSRGSKGSCSA